MGTPEIAATALGNLIGDGHNVVAVVTREDKPRGRGNVMTPTPVKKLALESGIPVYTPSTLKDEAFARLLEEISPDLIVVVAYGKILPKSVLEFPAYGCINMHVSLLPKYRGAAPMQRAIMDGEKTTGVTIMYMDEGLDTGDIISTVSFEIADSDNLEDIHDRSADLGSKLLSKTVNDIEFGVAVRVPQDDSLSSYAQKIEKSECHVDLSLPAKRLDAIIRGLTPIPGAYVYHGGKMLKIAKATPVSGTGEIGEVLECDGIAEGSFTFACGEGALRVSAVIPEGKGRMSAGDFIRGRKIAKGDKLS